MLDLRDKMIAHWSMTNICNWDCDYCYGHTKGAARVTVDVNDVMRCLDKAGSGWYVNLVGGEVFLISGFVDICHALTSSGFHINIETNMSVGPILNEFMLKINPSMVRMAASLHIEQREQRAGGVDRFVDHVTRFREHGFKVEVQYVLHPRLFNRLDDDVAHFRALGIAIEPHPYVGLWRNKLYPDAYTRQERGRILALNPTAGNTRNLAAKGSLCKAGMSFVAIKQSGEIHRCIGVKEILGNIGNGMQLHKEPQPCPLSRCPCWGQHLLVDFKKVDMVSGSFSKPTAKEYVRSRVQVIPLLYNIAKQIKRRMR